MIKKNSVQRAVFQCKNGVNTQVGAKDIGVPNVTIMESENGLI